MESQQNLTPYDEILRRIYYSPSNPGSFGGKERLFIQAAKINSNIKRKDVEKWLKGQIVYTLHKPARRKFKRNPVIAEYPRENFQADLVDLQEFKNENNGFKYLLTVIDIFSKKAWAIPLKDKTKTEVSKAMEKVLKDECPKKLQTDKGKEFDNGEFRDLMKKFNVNHFFAENKEIKCSVIERFNKTLKLRMFPYFSSVGGHKYINELDNLLNNYNNSYHKSIKMTPSEVNYDNTQIVFQNLYKCKNKREYLKNFKKPINNVGDDVRKKYEMKTHDRGYYPNWTDETFKIHKTFTGKNKPYYQIKDSRGNISKKKYYPEEIQTILASSYRVEKIIKNRTKNGVKEVFVKWLNYPESENSWIPASNLTKIDGKK